MTVILKQRTCIDKEGRAVPDGHPSSRFLVGPQGARISDDQAKSLGLKDGYLNDTQPKNSKHKEVRPDQNKEYKPEGDKGHSPSSEPSKANKDLSRKEQIQGIMKGMIKESEQSGEDFARLFTNSGLPDANVISSRLGSTVKSLERDECWEAIRQLANRG